MKLQQQAFTLVEIIVAIVVFLIGVSGVYAIMQSTMNLNSYNRDYIIATNLAREQIELVRNIRDTNFAKIQAYDVLQPVTENFSGTPERIEIGETYRISNDFVSSGLHEPVRIKTITTSFDKNNLQNMTDYRVCRFKSNDLHIYDYCEYSSGYLGYQKKETNFYKYIQIEAIEDRNSDVVVTKDINNTIIGYPAFKVTSEVVWKNRTVHSFDIQAIFTDYKIF